MCALPSLLFLPLTAAFVLGPDQGDPAARVAAGADAGQEAPLAVDGQPAAAGRVPEGTSEADRAAWSKLVGAVGRRARSGPADAPRSFELEFSMRYREEGKGVQESNVRFQYLEVGPGLVSIALLEKDGAVKSIQTRGLSASDRLEYWFRKFSGTATTDGWVKLTRRDYPTDRENIDTYADTAYDIARVTEPESCRIVSLRARTVAPETDLKRGWLQFVGDPGIQLPPNDVEGRQEPRVKTLRQLAANLVWLELATPDFRLLVKGRTSEEREADTRAIKRVVFGLDPKTGEPLLAIVSPTRDAALQVPGSVLFQCTEWFDHGPEGARSRLPGRLFAYECAPDRAAPRRVAFDPTPTADLYMLDGGAMGAPLTLEAFRPDAD